MDLDIEDEDLKYIHFSGGPFHLSKVLWHIGCKTSLEFSCFKDNQVWSGHYTQEGRWVGVNFKPNYKFKFKRPLLGEKK